MPMSSERMEKEALDAVRERIREYKKAYYLKNREKIKSRSIAYYAAHSEERKEWQRKYRKDRADEIRAKDKARRAKTRSAGKPGEPIGRGKE